jgi:Alpha amylase, C-terminal all-beta domain
VVVNLSDRQWQEHDYGINMNGEIGQWAEIFNSQSPQYGGWNGSGNYRYDLQVQEGEKLYVNLPREHPKNESRITKPVEKAKTCF